MRINFNNIDKTNYSSFKPLNSVKPVLNKMAQGDVFIRSSEISFSSRKFNQIYPELKQELGSYIMSSSDLSFEDMESIIQKYCPDVTVADLKDVPKNSNTSELMRAYFRNYITFALDDDENMEVFGKPEQGLYLTLPNNDDLAQRAVFASSSLHESTHMLQQNSSDREPYHIFIDKYLKQADNSKEAFKNIQAGNLASDTIYNEIGRIFLKGTRKENSLPVKIKGKSSKNLDNLYSRVVGVDAKTASNALLNGAFTMLDKKYGMNYDKKVVMDMILKKMSNEKEAFNNGYSFLKEALKITGNTDLDLMVSMFGTLVQNAKNYKL